MSTVSWVNRTFAAIGRAPADTASVKEIFLVGGLILVSDLRPGVWTIPTAGGEPRVLAAREMTAESPEFLGVSPEGVLLWRQFERGPVSPPGTMSTSRYVVTTSRIEDGKPPQPFWSTRARGVFPMKAITSRIVWTRRWASRITSASSSVKRIP